MQNSPSYRYDAFISYSSCDLEWARGELLMRIEERGFKAIIDFRDFEPGAPSISECERAMLQSRKTVLVLSPDYVASGWTEFESVMLQTTDPANRGRRLIPLLKTECESPPRLSALTYIDFRDGADHELAWRKLFDALGRPLEPEPKPGPVPQRDRRALWILIAGLVVAALWWFQLPNRLRLDDMWAQVAMSMARRLDASASSSNVQVVFHVVSSEAEAVAWRPNYARLIDTLHTAQAKVLAIDVDFGSAASDEKLLGPILTSTQPSVIVGADLRGRVRTVYAPFGSPCERLGQVSLQREWSLFRELNPQVNPARYALVDDTCPHSLALAAVAKFRDAVPVLGSFGMSVMYADTSVSLSDGSVYLPPLDGATLANISMPYGDLVQADSAHLVERFRDRIVLFGFKSPSDVQNGFPGYAHHANAMLHLVGDNTYNRQSWWVFVAVLALVGAGVPIARRRLPLPLFLLVIISLINITTLIVITQTRVLPDAHYYALYAAAAYYIDRRRARARVTA